MGLFEVRKPSHFPSTLLKSVTAAGCHWRVSQGAMELQATMRCKKAKPINPTILFIYILLCKVIIAGLKLTVSNVTLHVRNQPGSAIVAPTGRVTAQTMPFGG